MTNASTPAEGELTPITELDASWVALSPLEVRVVARSTVSEPFELSGLQSRRFWDEIRLVARALREVVGSAPSYELATDPTLQLIARTAEEVDGTTLARAIEAARTAPEAVSKREPVAAYDEIAEWFDTQSGSGYYNAHYERPAMLELIGDVPGQRILDVGCGPGFLLEALADRGARVAGIDGSTALLERARGRISLDVPLFHHDLNKPMTMFADASFDGVVSALVYHHIDDRRMLLAEMQRVLRPGGWVVMSTSHPTSDWLQSGGSYFPTVKVEAVFHTERRYFMPFWRMSMATLVNEIVESGLVLERLVEPVPQPETRDVDPRVYERLQREPGFVLLRARRR